MDNPIRTQVQELLSGVSQSNIVQTILGYIENNLGMAIGDRSGIEDTIEGYLQNEGEYVDPISNYIASLIDSYSNNTRRGPSYQSARIWYQGKDHKDIWYDGQYHKALWMNKPSWGMNGYEWKKLHDPVLIESWEVWLQYNSSTAEQLNSFLMRGRFTGDSYEKRRLLLIYRKGGGPAGLLYPVHDLNFYNYGMGKFGVRANEDSQYGPAGLGVNGLSYFTIDKTGTEYRAEVPGHTGTFLINKPIQIVDRYMYFGYLDSKNYEDSKVHVYRVDLDSYQQAPELLQTVEPETNGIRCCDDIYRYRTQPRGKESSLRYNGVGHSIAVLGDNILYVNGPSISMLRGWGDPLFNTWSRRYGLWPEEEAKGYSLPAYDMSLITLKEMSAPNEVTLRSLISDLKDKYCDFIDDSYTFVAACGNMHSFTDDDGKEYVISGRYDIAPSGGVGGFAIKQHGEDSGFVSLDPLIFSDMAYYSIHRTVTELPLGREPVPVSRSNSYYHNSEDGNDFSYNGYYYRYEILTFGFTKRFTYEGATDDVNDVITSLGESLADDCWYYDLIRFGNAPASYYLAGFGYIVEDPNDRYLNVTVQVPVYLKYSSMGVVGCWDFLDALHTAGQMTVTKEWITPEFVDPYWLYTYDTKSSYVYELGGFIYLKYLSRGTTKFYRINNDGSLTIVKSYTKDQEVLISYIDSSDTHYKSFKIKFTGYAQSNMSITESGLTRWVNQDNVVIPFDWLLPVKSAKLDTVTRTSLPDDTYYSLSQGSTTYWQIKTADRDATRTSDFCGDGPVIRCPFPFDFVGAIYWPCWDD